MLSAQENVNFSRTRPQLLAVIIPVFNEGATIREVIVRVAQSEFVSDVIVVDDGSTDRDCDGLCILSTSSGCRHIRHSTNQGKGAAIRSALPCIVAEYTIIQDADLEYDSRDYEKLLEPLLCGAADVVFGSRYLHRENRFSARIRFDLGVKLLNLAVQLIYGVKITDEATCYKVFPTSLLRAMDLQCERFEFCPEVTAKACRLGLRIKEVPISYSPRSIKEGKKIRLHDGFQALWTLWKYRNWEGHWDRERDSETLKSESTQTTDAVHAR